MLTLKGMSKNPKEYASVIYWLEFILLITEDIHYWLVNEIVGKKKNESFLYGFIVLKIFSYKIVVLKVILVLLVLPTMIISCKINEYLIEFIEN